MLQLRVNTKRKTMSKTIIGALVAAIIMFIWGFLSFGLLGLHYNEMAHTPAQEEVLSCLEGKLQPGYYYMPQAPKGSSMEEYEAINKANTGKPWALIHYHASLNPSMSMPMIRNFAGNFLAALLLVWLLGRMKSLTLIETLLSCLSVGSIGYLMITYSNAAWFETPTLVSLLDTAITYSLVGLWLYWWMNRK